MRKIIFPVLLTGALLLSIFLIIEQERSSQKKVISNLYVQQEQHSKNVEISSDKTIELLFTGDMMFDRNIRSSTDEEGYDFIFRNIKGILSENDYVIANLEGPISDNQSVSLGSEPGSSANYIFTFDPSLAPALSENNIKIVNIGNNHVLNFEEEGLIQTISYLDKAGVNYFGDTGTDLIEQRYLIIEISGVRIAFVNYNQFVANAESNALEDIRSADTNADIIILYTHWGIEYELQANFVIQSLAKDFIDAGVDLIIGSHPHVIQQKEEYKGKTIYYSLGNFIFDQYFSEETKNGLLVKVVIDPETLGIKTDEIPIYTESNGQTRLINIPAQY